MKFIPPLIMAVICLSAAAGELLADEAPAAQQSNNTPAAGEPEQAAQPPDLDRTQKAVTLGLMVLFCIALIGLGLVGVVILWGHRVRRISRKPLPAAPRGDELFYLKSGKQQASREENTTVIPPRPENEMEDES